MSEILMGEEQSGNIEFDKPISERFKKKNYIRTSKEKKRYLIYDRWCTFVRIND